MDEDLIGKTIKNRYRVDKFLGRGGMAEVYKVFDTHRSVSLAMKVLYPDLAEDPAFVRRFKREARNLAKLQHPNIVRFYEMEQDDLLVFLTMDYIEGTSLRSEIMRAKGAPLSNERILEVMNAVCGALYYAHRSGTVHCDVKPANIMIEKTGRILLADFGIARQAEGSTTTTMATAGTPAYMAPEQVRGEDPTPQTDIYALGVILYEMLTGGERPFTGEQATITGTTGEKVRWEQVNVKPGSPRRHNQKINEDLESIIYKCLSKKPQNRFENTLILLEEISNCFGQFDFTATNEIVSGSHIDVPSPENTNDKSLEKNAMEVNQKNQEKNGLWLLLGLLIVFALTVLFIYLGFKGEGPLRSLATNTFTPTNTSTFTLTFTPTYTNTFTSTNTELPTATKRPTNTPKPPPTKTPKPAPTSRFITFKIINHNCYPEVIYLDGEKAGIVSANNTMSMEITRGTHKLMRCYAGGYGTCVSDGYIDFYSNYSFTVSKNPACN